MAQRLIQTQKQTLSQTLTPQQLLQVHLLELPLRDFEQRVNDEILENEALEEGDDNERHDEEENGENDYGDEETKDADSSREDALADYLNADDTPDYLLDSGNVDDEKTANLPFGQQTSLYEELTASAAAIAQKAAEEATTANKALFDAMKDALDGKVKEVKVSTRLKDHPVCLSADGPLSIEMEKVLSKQPGSEGVKSDKVLELNVNHPVFAVLKAAQEAGDTEKLKKYSALLYAQAQLIEGLPVDDPAAYAEAVCSLMQ